MFNYLTRINKIMKKPMNKLSFGEGYSLGLYYFMFIFILQILIRVM
ncbi:hypothetical protein Dacet_0614 [Denitrovibrio acetiphilus DSM 12809]|jgi:hypothetical protein|uniref:Uncharacterized protein n=1 Tax=Denitrovibrio acetiphilus (strain DSM 12809 / NBRC 114555 / N2460) TaxID=522772 RepID=D4H4L4_DENA2|nr:hypothetical protein Dacet_0614 [Denitrovibrio acetiphilus DSM 12809]